VSSELFAPPPRPGAASSSWVTPAGQPLTIAEDSPGIVHVSTSALHELLRLAGFSEAPKSIQGVAVQGTSQVLRDSHGRCQECGTTPAEHHRDDCPHHVVGPLRGEQFGVGAYERRPGTGGEERR
jgi:hypothetical protein